MTFISTLGQTLDQIERLKTTQLSLADFQTQMTTGKKTQSFTGLGGDAITSLRSRADLKTLDSYDANITTAQRRMQVMMNSISQIRSQAESVAGAIDIQTEQGNVDIKSIGDLAGKALDFINDLLNQRDGDRYVFAGAESLTKPFSDNGTLDTYAQTQVDSWINGGITTDQLIDSYTDPTKLNDTVMGFSAGLSSGNTKGVSVRVAKTTEIDFTVLANDPGFRDIISGLTMLKNLGTSLDKVSIDPTDNPLTTATAPGLDKDAQNNNFFQAYNDIAVKLNGSLDKMDQMTYTLSQTSAQIDQISDDHKQQQNVLNDTVTNVEDADMNEVALKLNALQVQLEASYRVTGALQSLSFVNFFPTT
jgi:flagellar hook-associated protein 3 FlgL